MARTPDTHGPTVLTGSYADIIASDGTNIHEIRTITLTNTDSASRNVFLAFGVGAAGTEVVEVAVPANDTKVLNGYWALPISTKLQGKASVTSVVNVTVSGYHYV